MVRWINNCTAEQSARLYHKYDKAQGSDFARVVATEMDTAVSEVPESMTQSGELPELG